MPTLTGLRDTYPYPAGHSRAELRVEVARFFGWYAFTATGGSTTTLVNNQYARFADDYFINANVWIEQAGGAAPQNEDSYCTDFVSSTGTLTVSPAFTQPVQAGDKAQIFMRCAKADIDNALAKVGYGATALAQLTPSATTLDYSLNAVEGLHSGSQLVAVWLRAWNDADSLPYMLPGWQIADDDGILTLRLPGLLNPADGLWIEFNTGEDHLQTDDARINLPVALVKARAICWLIETVILPKQDNVGLQHGGTILRDQRDVLAREERQRNIRPGKARGHNWESGRTRDAATALGLREHFGGDFGNYP